MIQLAAAVVGDVNHVNASFHTAFGVIAVHDTFHHQRDVVLCFDVGNGVPGHGGLMRKVPACGRGATRLGHVALHHVTLAAGVDLSVRGQTKAGVSRGYGALNVIVHPGVVAHQIQLIDTRPRDALGHGLVVRRTSRTENLQNAKLFGCSSHAGAATGLESLHRADGREYNRNPHWTA